MVNAGPRLVLTSNPLNAGSIYTWDPSFVSIVPADGLAPNGARPSAGTVLITKLHMFLL